MSGYWLIERNQLHGEPVARWFSKRVHAAGGSRDLWVQDVSRAERFKTKEDAEESIALRFSNDDRYPVLPIATDHIDVVMLYQCEKCFCFFGDVESALNCHISAAICHDNKLEVKA
jgi:hypothetical protein